MVALITSLKVCFFMAGIEARALHSVKICYSLAVVMLFFNWAVGRGLQLEVTWITSSFYFFCLFWHRVLLCGGQVLPHLVCSLGWPQIWAPHASSLVLPSLKLKVFDTMSGLMLNLNLNCQGSLLGLLNLAMEHIASEEPEFSSYVSLACFWTVQWAPDLYIGHFQMLLIAGGRDRWISAFRPVRACSEVSHYENGGIIQWSVILTMMPSVHPGCRSHCHDC